MDSNVNAASEMATDAPSKVTSKIGYNSASKIACKWKVSRADNHGVHKTNSLLEVEIVTEAAFIKSTFAETSYRIL